jgi:hypothetical protein
VLAMSYDPQNHTPSTKQVVAAWTICLCIVGLVLGLTIGCRDVVPNAVAGPMNGRVTANPGPLAGVRIPEFAICRAELDQCASALEPQKHGPMSAPASQWGAYRNGAVSGAVLTVFETRVTSQK